MADQKIIGEEIEELKFPDGKVAKLRQPSGVYYSRCLEMAGSTTNLIPFFEALCCVVSLDGENVVAPTSRMKADALAQKVGRKNLDVLTSWYQQKLYPELTDILVEAQEQGIPADEIEVFVARRRAEMLKNSQATQ